MMDIIARWLGDHTCHYCPSTLENLGHVLNFYCFSTCTCLMQNRQSHSWLPWLLSLDGRWNITNLSNFLNTVSNHAESSADIESLRSDLHGLLKSAGLSVSLSKSWSLPVGRQCLNLPFWSRIQNTSILSYNLSFPLNTCIHSWQHLIKVDHFTCCPSPL